MKILIISDTHSQHEKLGVLTADVLIHCVNASMVNSQYDLVRQPCSVDLELP